MALPADIALADGIRDRQWYLSSLAISQTRSITTGSGVVVAVLDTGTYPHPDLKRNLLKGIDETGRPGGDGQSDQVGHGTGMASLIAGHGRAGGSGIEGIAPSAKILPVRVTQTGHNIASAPMAAGIGWAVSHGAKVINVSAGTGPGFELQDAVDAALDDDAIVVAAAGNTSSDVVINYPAALDGVLAVGATGRNGKHASISVKGAKVEICAPGTDINSAQPRNRYRLADGTSGATAIVSGAAALVRAKFPRLSGKEVVHRLTATADDIGPPGRDNECGFGRLNIVKALTADVPPLDGEAAPSVSASPTATTPAVPTADSTSAAAAAPETESTGSSAPLIFGGLVGLIVAGALVAVFVIRRRRTP